MRILIIGGTGMLGHRLWIEFCRLKHDVWGTVRQSKSAVETLPDINQEQILDQVNIFDDDQLLSAFNSSRPEVVINCVGIIKQKKEAYDPISSLKINSLFPHKLSLLCKTFHSRLIHFSTDCVFDGKRGDYTEGDLPNAVDLYGKSKHLGEISEESHALTLRTSVVGRELNSAVSLFEWFLSQKKDVLGFKRAIFSGLTTKAMAHVLHEFVFPNPQLSGLYHLASKPISKYHLLEILKETSGHSVKINPEEKTIISRQLNCQKFSEITGYQPLSWDEMMKSFALDFNFYREWRSLKI